MSVWNGNAHTAMVIKTHFTYKINHLILQFNKHNVLLALGTIILEYNSDEYTLNQSYITTYIICKIIIIKIKYF